MKLFALVSAVLLLAGTASADQWKTITIKTNSNNYDYQVSYPAFLAGSTPAYQKINARLADYMSYGCELDANQSVPESGYQYSAKVLVTALNKNYLSVSIDEDDYCGGFNPNATRNYMTFDAQTGEEIDMRAEFGFQNLDSKDFDVNKEEAQTAKIANLLADKVLANPKLDVNGCYAGQKKAAIVDDISATSYVLGLARDRKVVLGTQPPHVNEACQFEARVDYNEVKKWIVPGSRLNAWLAKAPSAPTK